MSEAERIRIDRWNVQYGLDGERQEVIVPHAWKQDVPVTCEGPVVYRTVIEVPRGRSHLLFSGVSYAAEVKINDRVVCRHRGIWDAFAVPLDEFASHKVDVEVTVVKNGGPTYPVRDVASGFLPFVFNTFGGIFGEVDLVSGLPHLERPPKPSRVSVKGRQIFLDGRPFYLRGLLHWGWYPDLGHANPPEETIREEVRAAKARGFNLVKFCLWVPPHRYLEILREEAMEAWIELPLWDPTPDPVCQNEIADEFERIVRQYRHHDNVVVWTVGCELSGATSPAYREYLTQLVHGLTGCPLVKDNSGGAEMYGGDLREFGDLYDFHPYCDTPFYPPVLDSLLPGPRPEMPLLLGEFNDIDLHRDLSRIGDELPYWASNLPELNDQGVRWQYDLPVVIDSSRFALHPTKSRHVALMRSSCAKALFMRKTVQEVVRARDAISGYVITGWRDTPISSSGFFDDWGDSRFSPEDCLPWNGESALFLIPTRRPPWVEGGNRPGWLDPLNHFVGQVFWRVGVHSERPLRGGLVWTVIRGDGHIVARGAESVCEVPALCSVEVAQISWQAEEPGEYRLVTEFAGTHNEWPIWVVPPLGVEDLAGWSLHDPDHLFGDLDLSGSESNPVVASRAFGRYGSGLLFLTEVGTKRMPFWREAAYEFPHPDFWAGVPFADRWERLLPVSADRAIDLAFLEADGEGPWEVLMNRVDTRTYADHPIVVRRGGTIVTTLRPYGGLGSQPSSLSRNPAGVALLRALAGTLKCASGEGEA